MNYPSLINRSDGFILEMLMITCGEIEIEIFPLFIEAHMQKLKGGLGKLEPDNILKWGNVNFKTTY